MKIKIVILLLICFSMSGCFNYREINDLAILTAIGIDKKENNYNVTLQIVNTQLKSQNINNTNNPDFYTYTFEGATIQEALRNMIKSSPKRTYGNHLKILLISEEIAKEGLNKGMDFFIRDSESEKQFLMVISRNTSAKEILETTTPLIQNNSQNIYNLIKSNDQYLSEDRGITLDQAMEILLNDYQELTLPSIVLVKEEDNQNNENENIKSTDVASELMISETGIFKQDKLIGYLSEEQERSLLLLNNKGGKVILTEKCDNEGNLMSGEITKYKTKININENTYDVNIKFNFALNQYNCNTDLDKKDNLKKIEKKIESKIKNDVLNSIYGIINTYDSDVFGFADLMYKNKYNYFNKFYNKSFLKSINFKLKVNINKISKGNELKSLKGAFYE